MTNKTPVSDNEIMVETVGDMVQMQMNQPTNAPRLDGDELDIVMTLADHYSFATGHCTVSMSRLRQGASSNPEKPSYTAAQVYQALKGLVAKGVVTIESWPGFTNSYTLHFLADRDSVSYMDDHFGQYGCCEQGWCEDE